MVPLSAVDSINPAFEHTKTQLFRPFRFWQWTKLALVGLIAGEMGTGGGGAPSFNFNVPAGGHSHKHLATIPHLDAAVIALLIVLFLVVIPLLWLLFIYLNSRMRFVLFDSVVAKNCSIGAMWRARGGPALQYFIWQILFSLITLAGFAIIIGIPAFIAFLLGWFSAPREHIGALILAGLSVFSVFFAFMVVVVTVHVFTKDFVVPQMALEGISAFEGWRRLMPMLRAEKGGYAGYAGIKVVLTLGAAFLVAIVAFFFILILLIPFGGLGLISVLVAKGAGVALSWSVLTVTAVIVAGAVFLFLLFYGIALISVPIIVFFPAYSIYFFAARYQRLAAVLYPPPPMPPAPLNPTPEPA